MLAFNMARYIPFAATAAVLILTAPSAGADPSSLVAHDSLPEVMVNDNRRPAGTRDAGTLVLDLRAAVGRWRPEGATGPALEIEAFGERTGPLQAPAPLIRVPEGTEIVASIRNDLDVTLRVHGLCSHDATPCAPIELSSSSSRRCASRAGAPGRTTTGQRRPGCRRRFVPRLDTQLSGAFIVDPPDADPGRRPHLVITEWTSLTGDQLNELARADDVTAAFFAMNPKFTSLINGLSWPATERLTYRVGEHVRWRVLNLSTQPHPMHLHGFYYEVESLGDGVQDDLLRRRPEATRRDPVLRQAERWR